MIHAMFQYLGRRCLSLIRIQPVFGRLENEASMNSSHYPQLQRPTQFDPDEIRRRAPDPARQLGAEAFANYRLAIARAAADESTRIPRNYVFLSILFQMAAIAAVYAPWGQYQSANRRIVQIRGIEVNGALIIFFGIIAVISLALVLVLNDTALIATIGFGVASVCTIIGAWTWIRFDSWTVHDGLAVAATSEASWGIVAVTFASLLAAICGYFVMRVARLY